LFLVNDAGYVIKEDTTALLKLCKNLNHDRIGVSRLCCPVCWDLLSVLKATYFGGDEEDEREVLIVRGRHPMVHEVELPQSLPIDIVRAMVTKYERKLYDQLFL